MSTAEQTEVGSYFVANYPPFSVWTEEAVGRDALAALRTPASATPVPQHSTTTLKVKPCNCIGVPFPFCRTVPVVRLPYDECRKSVSQRCRVVVKIENVECGCSVKMLNRREWR